MGLLEKLKNLEGILFVTLPIGGYFVGRYIEKEIKERIGNYLQKNKEAVKESIKEAVKESIILNELQEIKKTIATNYQEISLKISELEKYKKGQ